ncbi:hypothetical protein FACS1894189_9310 [Planctomycetales bacterium]|nr:hypothetical protein FACS1894189_9310 [Planctomycetales bacterium]
MNSKITRRVVLGTVVGCLAAGPFVVRALRKKTSVVPVKPYETPNVAPGQVKTDLSEDELRLAFETLSQVRESWLQFRGLDAQLAIQYKSSGKTFPQGVDVSGHIEYRVEMLPNETGTHGGGVLPSNTKIAFLPEDKSASWTFEMKGSRSPDNPPKIEGRPLNEADPLLVYQMLSIPPSLAGLVNNTIKDNLSWWQVTRNTVAASKQDSYVSESNGKSGSEGMLPTIGITNGFLSEYIPKRLQGHPYPIITFSEYFTEDGASFPRTITAYANGSPLSYDDCIAFVFSDIKFVK